MWALRRVRGSFDMFPRCFSLLCFSLLLAPILVASGSTAEVMRPCLEYGEDLTTGGNKATGIAQPVAVDDADWRVTSIAGVATSQPARTLAPSLAWAPPASYARYVNPWVSTDPGGWSSAPASVSSHDYTYVTEFTITQDLESGYTLKLRFAADNSVKLRLNGQPLDLFSDGAATHKIPRTLDYGELARSMSRFKLGVNVLEAAVHNNGSYTGLLVEGEFRAVCLWSPSHCPEDSISRVTGEGRSPGQPDAWWTVGSAPAKAVARDPGWVVPPSGSWINPSGTNVPSAPVGIHTYRLVLTIPCLPFDCASSGLSIDLSADDHAYLKLNGVGITPTYWSAWGTLRHVDHSTCQNTFLLGTNVLEAVVHNTGGPGGLLMQVSYQ